MFHPNNLRVELRFLFFLGILSIISPLSGQDFPKSTLDLHHSEATSVQFASNGRLSVGCSNGKLFFWNMESMSTDNVLEDEKGIITKTAFSPDGRILASGGKDKSIFVWDVVKGIDKFHLQGHSGAVTALAISHDGHFLASAGVDQTVIVWKLSDGSVHQKLTGFEKGITTLDFAHSDNLLVTADYKSNVKIFNLQTGGLDRKFNLNSGKIKTVKFSPNDKYIAIGTEKKQIFLYDLTVGVNRYTFEDHKSVVYDLEFSPDGKFLASAGLDNKVDLWDLKSAEKVGELKGFYKLVSIAFSVDGKHLAAADFSDKLKVYDIASLGIDEDNNLNKIEKGGVLVASPPEITMINPNVISGEKHFHNDPYIQVKGTVSSEAGLFLLLVDGVETPVDDEGNFSQRVRVGYFENEIHVKAIDKEKQVSEVILNLYRPYKDQKEITESFARHGKDYALLIATDHYESWGNLSNPIHDAETIGKELEQLYGFEVDYLIDPTKEEILLKIRDYAKREYGDQDQLFIFVAGHGEFDAITGEGYLVASDSKAGDVAKSSYLSHSTVRTIINNIKCKHIMLTLDVCFGGTFDQKIANRGGDQTDEMNRNEYIIRKLRHRTRVYLTSGGKEYVPDGRPGHHSPFTRHFLAALRGGGGEDKIMTLSELFSYVEKTRPEPRHGEFGDNEPGSEFLFIGKI